MNRREFIGGLAGAAAWPLAARAQQPSRERPKIGYLHPATIDPTSPVVSILEPTWRQLGYRQGETILLRSAEGDNGRLPGLITELLYRKVEVLMVVGPEALRLATAATSEIPIIALDLETDPVRSGFIRSWARPGGNVTGLFQDQASLTGKWFELLRDVHVAMKRIALVWDPATGSDQLDAALTIARSFQLETVVLKVSKSQDIAEALARLEPEPPSGAILLGSPILVNPPHHFADAAIQCRLPSVSFFKPIAEAGGLMSWGANLQVWYPRSIYMAHQIVNGAKPSDIPAERPNHYELAINLQTAKALNLSIPPSLLARADEVIE